MIKFENAREEWVKKIHNGLIEQINTINKHKLDNNWKFSLWPFMHQVLNETEGITGASIENGFIIVQCEDAETQSNLLKLIEEIELELEMRMEAIGYRDETKAVDYYIEFTNSPIFLN